MMRLQRKLWKRPRRRQCRRQVHLGQTKAWDLKSRRGRAGVATWKLQLRQHGSSSAVTFVTGGPTTAGIETMKGKADDRAIPDAPQHRDANALTTEDLRSEMARYGIPAHESGANTILLVQKKFDDEYAAQMATYTKLVERYRRKQAQQEAEAKLAREADAERDAFAQHPKIHILVKQIQANETNTTLTVRGLNDVTARAVLRAMAINQSVAVLDFAQNGLNEQTMTELAHMVRANKRLASLDLGSNRLNAKCVVELAKALTDNSVLTALSLESNPITVHGNTSDLSGLEALCGYISNTTTLQSLNLFRTGLNVEAGRLLAKSLLFNESIYMLDLGGNAMTDKEMEVIGVQLAENRQVHDTMAAKLFEKKQAVQAQAAVKRAEHALEQLKLDTEAWHQANAVTRREERVIEREEERKRQADDDERLRKAAADKERVFRAQLEEAKAKAEKKAKK
ncbi:hypothetical protein AeRB84_011421 [Aphanomyces euteiches]|nr:hypothetical protein AeRB84_011421 [Aphanomyces euteiches]